MKKSEKLLLAAAGVAGVAAAAVAAAYGTTRVLIKTALDREKPKIMNASGNKISGKTLSEEDERICADASEKLRNLPHETIEITAKDGVRLVGHLFNCENAERIIIAFHGWRSSWNYDYGLISDFWHKNGCTVLYAEQRGQNNSGGEYMGFGLTERHDCVDWAEEINRRFGEELPIYLAGISMGATTVLMASDLSLPKNVHGIMADCGFTSPKEIWRHVAQNNLHMIYGVRSLMADAMCRQKINIGSGDHSTLDALSKTDIPVLFVHGTDDRFVPVGMTYENYKACNSPKRLLIVPGAEHAMSYCVNRYEYEKVVLEFWKEFDFHTAL